MPFSAVDRTALAAADAATKSLDAGSTWTVSETSGLTGLTIAKGAKIAAPKGYSVTMTIDGVETPIKEGSYKGKIVLTITKENVITASVFGDVSTYIMRAAIDVEDGVYMKEKSVEAAAVGGKVTNASAKDVSITSVGDNFNGIIVQGKSTYTIDNPKIKLTGFGGNDFAGYGAAIMTEGNADVTVNKASIINKGAIRTSVVVRGNSTVHVNDSYLEVNNGPLPEDYSFSYTNPNGKPLMVVPWMLGLTGNCRATNLIENGTAYYTNTHIKAQGWGCLSTDNVQNVKLYVTNCHIETIDSGYGSYADGSSNTFSKTKFDVKDYALIMGGGSGVFTDECVVNSGRIGVMLGGGNLTIDKGSIFNAKKAVIQVKGGSPTIVVDNAKLNSESGMILQAMMNDDPNKSGGSAPSSASGGAPAAGGSPNAGGVPKTGGSPNASSMPAGPGGRSGSVTATFKNMTMNGDIVSSLTSQGDVIVNLEKATITGAITTATAVHAVGPNGEKLFMQDKADLYYLIGNITETYCTTADKYGVKVSLDGSSTWIVNKNSYLTSLTIAEGAGITTPKGYKVTMTVDGVVKEIKAGDYKGKIVLIIAKA